MDFGSFPEGVMMVSQSIGERITQASDGNIGVYTALLVARNTLGDDKVVSFLDKVPEKGEELWKRFRTLQREKGDWVTFNHLIASVLMPREVKSEHAQPGQLVELLGDDIPEHLRDPNWRPEGYPFK